MWTRGRWRSARDVVLLALAALAVIAVIVGSATSILPGRARADVIEGADGWLFPGWVRTIDERPHEAAEAADEIARAHAALAARGVRLMVVLAPTKARGGGDRAPGFLTAKARRGHGYADWIAGLRGRGVPVVDALPVLQAADRAGVAPFLARDTHWTAPAAERVADAAAREVARTGALIGPAIAGQALGPWRMTERRGDLAALLVSRGQGSYPPDRVWQRTYTAPAAGAPAVRVAGSSFIAADYGFPQRLSEGIGRPVETHIVFGEHGAWDALADTLKAPPPAGTVVVFMVTEGALTSRRAGPERR